MSLNKHLEQVEKVVCEFAKSYQIGRTRSNHLAIEMVVNGQRRTVFFSGTPSDHRAIKNFRTKVRKMTALMAA